MRVFLVILISLGLLTAKAQTRLPGYPWGLGYSQWQPLASSVNNTQKWQLRPSAGIYAGYMFLNGGISYLAAPFSLNLYHPLNSNVTAFAGVSVTPTLFNSANPYGAPYQNPMYPGHYNLSVNPAVQGGLIYTNDAHTFSISGSVWMERSSYPVYSPPQSNYRKQP